MSPENFTQRLAQTRENVAMETRQIRKYSIPNYDENKTVREAALTRGTHSLYTEGEKWLSSQCGKSDKKYSNNYTQTTCTSSYHEENTQKFQNSIKL